MAEQGPPAGFWQASDGSWHPPQTHPDPAWRAHLLAQAGTPQPANAIFVPPPLTPPAGKRSFVTRRFLKLPVWAWGAVGFAALIAAAAAGGEDKSTKVAVGASTTQVVTSTVRAETTALSNAVTTGAPTPTTTTTVEKTTTTKPAKPTTTKAMTLSEAFCSDLAKGSSPFALWKGTEDRFPTPKAFADYAYGAAAISCPDQLKTNEALRALLTGWGINPDS